MSADVVSLNPKERAVYDLLRGAAARGEPCPPNSAIQALLGSETLSIGPKYLRRLERKGLIKVMTLSRGRVVTIMRTGKSTLKPSNMPLHWRSTRVAAVEPVVAHVLHGRAPAPGFERLREDYGALADDIRTEAFKMGSALPDFLSALVLRGWRQHVHDKVERQKVVGGTVGQGGGR